MHICENRLSCPRKAKSVLASTLWSAEPLKVALKVKMISTANASSWLETHTSSAWLAWERSFLCTRPPPPHRSLPFFPDLHTEVCRSWGRPYSARLFIPASDYYGNVAGLNEHAIVVGPEQALVMEKEVKTLLRKEAIEVGPPHERESGFYSRYFIVPKKDGGLRPIIDLRQLNHSVSQLKFKMLTLRQVVSQIRSEDWFVTIDLKDAYFHVSILPCHRKFLRFAFGGKAYQYRVLPFGQAVSEVAGSDGSCVQRDTIWPAVHENPTVVAQDQGIFPEGKST